MRIQHRRWTLVAVAATSISLAVAAPAFAGLGNHYATQSRPSSGANYSYITHDGCQAKNVAKPDRGQTIYLDDVSSSSSLICNDVGVRLYYYAGTGSAYTGWDYDWDAAQVLRSTYLTTQHNMRVVEAFG